MGSIGFCGQCYISYLIKWIKIKFHFGIFLYFHHHLYASFAGDYVKSYLKTLNHSY